MAVHSPGSSHPPDSGGDAGADFSVRVTLPPSLAEEAGAILMDVLGPFEEEQGSAAAPATAEPCLGPQSEPAGGEAGAASATGGARVTLVFYPATGGPSTHEELLQLLPDAFAGPAVLQVETGDVSRDWVEGWREHFKPVVIGTVRIRPPWEPPCARPGGVDAVDVVVNPGLGFGTGLHPTTRGTLLLLQEGAGEAVAAGAPRTAAEGAAVNGGSAAVAVAADRGLLVDVGTGSGILAIAAAKLGWGPVVALDNDPFALASARENVAANGVQSQVDIHEAGIAGADVKWFRGATVLANMTLEPVTIMLRRLAAGVGRPRRVVVSGILAGSQEEQLMLIAYEAGFTAGRRLYEAEWVSLELLPSRSKD